MQVDDQVPTSNVIRSEEFWYPDGSVVLVAGNTTFRVYQGLLSQHSVVFRDMFTIPQPEIAEKMDGCPIVRLSESPQELVHVLRVLHGGNLNLLRPDVEGIPFAILAALVRFGHKYEMLMLRDQALKLLDQVFYDTPSKFTEFTFLSEHLDYAPVEIHLREAITVVNLARLTNTLSMLPLALYMCSQLDEELILGFEQDGRREQLDPADAVLCVSAKQRLSHDITHLLFRMFEYDDSMSKHCADRDFCVPLLHDAMERVGLENYGTVLHFGPLDGWDHFMEEAFEPVAPCSSCQSRTCKKKKLGRMQIWRNLFVYFKLDNQT
ncbi:hypothetical protein OBBRIDRAFT_798257 [Obba rivulosa]|uniref:BTB domain-containing protein n=1 Tax=Obba rivulosa TaxID=1052685 RepID=A0A8E2DH09_9APHY|nr:hypothetical protein OBBRIDRAFT_798257 [Obba rivulosa]